MVMEKWTVYLSGEIHSDWRDKIREGCLERNLPVVIVGPITNHEASDNCGVKILGKEDNLFWKEHVSDLKGWASEAASTYSVRGIPYNYLIDADGTIISKNLRGIALHQQLDKLVKSL